jgi:hypothetical protein
MGLNAGSDKLRDISKETAVICYELPQRSFWKPQTFILAQEFSRVLVSFVAGIQLKRNCLHLKKE